MDRGIARPPHIPVVPSSKDHNSRMLSLTSLVILAFTIGLAIASIRRPGYSLTLVLSVYALEQSLQSSFPIFLQRGYLINVGVAIVVAIAAVRNWISGNVRTTDVTRAYLAIVTLFAFAFLSCAWSTSQEFASTNFEKYLPYWIVGVFLPPFAIKDSKDLNHAMSMLVWFGALIVLDLVSKQYVGRSVYLGSVKREEFLGNPLAASTFAGYVAIAAVFRIYIGRPELLKLCVLIGVVLLAIYAIVISGSRGQLLAIAATGMIWLPMTARVVVKRSMLGGFALAALICIIGYFLVDVSGFAYRWDRESASSSVAGRFDRAGYLLQMFLNGSPFTFFFGLGSSASFKYFQSYCHVVPVEVLCELGLFGFAIFTWFVYRTLQTAYLYMSHRGVAYDSRVQMGMLASLLTFEFILCFKQGSLLGSTNFFVFGLLVMTINLRKAILNNPHIGVSDQM